MMIASFFLFMLLHGSAVCNELYPISVVEDIIQEQPEWSSDNYIEPLGQTIYDEANPAANPSESGPMATYTKEDVAWMKTEIVDQYKFKKDPKFDIWTYQPDFKNYIGTEQFSITSQKVELFFKRNSNWDVTKTIYRGKDSCIELLYITAARYMLVTNILYEQSINKQLIPCMRTPDKKIMIPASVCYPAPYGSATCTSDYDVGLIGKDSGLLVAKFNEYFQDVNRFGKPSEFVFDTNVYAYSLEFAMPAVLFVDLPIKFADDLKKMERTDDYKMQELASAYYKVFKYNEIFFKDLKDIALAAMKVKKSQHTNLVKWLEIFSKMDATETKMKRGGYDSPEALRNAHNKQYQQLLQQMSNAGGYKPAIQDILARAEIYAAEAYHTRGAIRHIVGVMQMRVGVELTLNDLWVSMIENWGESNKEYNHCGNVILPKECFLKMSKYLWRMFTAMDRIHGMLQNEGILVGDVMRFLSGGLNPTWVMMVWNNYKKKGINVTNKNELDPFLTQFNCGQNGLINLAGCMANMQKSVMGYNKKLAGLQLKQQLILSKINIGEGIKRK